MEKWVKAATASDEGLDDDVLWKIVVSPERWGKSIFISRVCVCVSASSGKKKKKKHQLEMINICVSFTFSISGCCAGAGLHNGTCWYQWSAPFHFLQIASINHCKHSKSLVFTLLSFWFIFSVRQRNQICCAEQSRDFVCLLTVAHMVHPLGTRTKSLTPTWE